jgi:hypothetical protein
MTFEDFATQHEITATMQAVDTRHDTSGDSFAATAVHYAVTLTMGTDTLKTRVLWQGNYSTGFGNAESWARKNLSKFGFGQMRDQLRHPLPFGKRYRDDSDYVQTVRRVAGKHMRIPVAGILCSLQMDVSGSDQCFADWAGDLGYDSDSIKARDIWETCNNIRRGLRDAMGQETFNAFLDCEES